MLDARLGILSDERIMAKTIHSIVPRGYTDSKSDHVVDMMYILMFKAGIDPVPFYELGNHATKQVYMYSRAVFLCSPYIKSIVLNTYFNIPANTVADVELPAEITAALAYVNSIVFEADTQQRDRSSRLYTLYSYNLINDALLSGVAMYHYLGSLYPTMSIKNIKDLILNNSPNANNIIKDIVTPTCILATYVLYKRIMTEGDVRPLDRPIIINPGEILESELSDIKVSYK
jgi:hypothetical protein